MKSIIEYIQSNGQKNFKEQPINDVDNIIFSELSYVNLGGIVPTPDSEGHITVKEAARQFQKYHPQEDQALYETTKLLYAMAESPRFKDLSLSNYVNLIEEQKYMEFSVLHIGLDDGTTYIAYRGTTDVILGWRENFSMSFQCTPSQLFAAEYLLQTMTTTGTYYVGGHSKGGNLAVYACMALPEIRQEQILTIYNNDGPGLRSNVILPESFQRIRGKIRKIVPEFSVIGSIFHVNRPNAVVASSSQGMAQHDGMTWLVEGTQFAKGSKPSRKCLFINKTFEKWISSADLEQKKTFTREFFDALEAGGAKTLTAIGKAGFHGNKKIISSLLHSDRKTKSAMRKLITCSIQSFVITIPFISHLL